MYFTYLEVLRNALERNHKEIYCSSDITDKIQKDICYKGNICAKYGGTSFTYEILTQNPRELWWIFLYEILHFTMLFRRISLSKFLRLIFS